jgi:hypothetical protein
MYLSRWGRGRGLEKYVRAEEEEGCGLEETRR